MRELSHQSVEPVVPPAPLFPRLVSTLRSAFPFSRWLFAVLVVALPLVVILAVARQPLALLLLLLVLLLVWWQFRLTAWMRHTARQIEQRQHLEKVEVKRGTWGLLCRAINGLLHEQHGLRQLASLHPAVLPAGILAQLRAGNPHHASESAIVILGLQGSTADDGHLQHWSDLMQVARQYVQRHDGLLLPSGAAIQLVFGAFGDRSLGESLDQALDAVRVIAAACSGVVVASLVSGNTTTVLVPGGGIGLLGEPVDYAAELQRLALVASEPLLLCGERDYLRLSHSSVALARRLHLPQGITIQAPYGIYGLPLGNRAREASA